MAVIIKPLVTEKMTKMTERTSVDRTYTPKSGKNMGKQITKSATPRYGFIVSPDATKTQIKAEVEALFNVKVKSVNTMLYAGKTVSRYTKKGLVKGRRNAYKKAIVTLKPGGTIDFYSNIQ